MRRRRYRRRSQCAGKIRHTTKSSAAEHRDRLLAEGAARIDIYPCRHCDGLHVGHPSSH